MVDSSNLSVSVSPNNDTHDPRTQVYAVMGILSVFSITGTIGNAVAFYVFSSLKNKLTSTIFILALAGVDFITCLLIIPYTMAVEYLEFKVANDAVCKMYHFLITTTIPFSAFIMVAIAVDRYLCICHPFLHLMTIRRARIIVGCLSTFALSLGVIACIHYTVYKTVPVTDAMLTAVPSNGSNVVLTGNNSNPGYSSIPLRHLTFNETMGENNATSAAGYDDGEREGEGADLGTVYVSPVPKFKEMYTGECTTKKTMIHPLFFYIFTKIYSSFFVICCLIVFVLYSLIYRSVIAQRRKRLRIKTNNCCMSWDSANVDCEQSEVTEAMELNHSTANGETLKSCPDESNALDPNQMGNNSARARLERMRIANIKTAVMLFVVTLVFMVAFMPAWLMVHNIITLQLVFFYLYFVYNVANPIIYAFMNNTFRIELKKLFHCQN
ncbi:uncharacterized protein LOC121389661 [Gigantopelta aegis]|uniref:uncharacterized protein LOC121389661 n=1 Tax=Gigantopelta aegis TaxID=1735272 RepID=UPI001B88B76B|nr:uncharacterized protein LOC121389661 [Gigantopelta aegis]